LSFYVITRSRDYVRMMSALSITLTYSYLIIANIDKTYRDFPGEEIWLL